MTMVYTEVSQRQFDFVTQENISPEEVVRFLQTEFTIRKFSDVISRLYPGKDVEQKLAACMGDRKVVWNWMNGKNLPAGRETVYRIAFALGFHEEETNELLQYVFGEGINYRDKRELVFAYMLKVRGSYEQAESLFQQLGTAENTMENAPANIQTYIVRNKFQEQESEADFVTFMMSHQEMFGGVHQTAYQIFMDMLSCLVLPVGEKEMYSLEHIAESYFRMGMPKQRSTRSMDACQKMLKWHWPGLKRIKNMKNKRENVNRKTLLLLYIITEGLPHGDHAGMKEELSLLIHLRNIDAMLEKCNMKHLDPRNPFDFFIIYSLNVNETDSMTERMETLVRLFIPEDNESDKDVIGEEV